MTTATSRMPAASYSRSPWNALWSMMIGFFMIMLDSTIVAIANPTIMAVLHVGYATVVWVTSAYLLGYAVVLLVAGRLGDRFGPKNLYLTGLAVFTAASMWCGLSGSAGALITARVVQGVGAGLLTPQTLSIITRTFPAARRGVAMSMWGGDCRRRQPGRAAGRGGHWSAGWVGSGSSSSTSRSAYSAWRWRPGWSRSCRSGHSGST